MDEPQPASLPVEITKRKGALSLYQIVIIALSAIGLCVVLGGILLSFFDRTIPESVIVLGSVAVGALASMVAPSKGSE